MRYWQRYDKKYKVWGIKKIYYFIQSKARKVGKPFGKKGKVGRPPALNPYEYTAAYVVFTFLDSSLRDDEFLSDMMFEKHIDHSTFGKAFHRIDEELYRKIRGVIEVDENEAISLSYLLYI